jgi:hypothetical protein
MPLHVLVSCDHLQKAVTCYPETAACWRSLVPTFRIEGVTWSAQRIPTAKNFGFLGRSRYFLQIAPQLSSRGAPLSRPTTSQKKCGSVGNQTQTSGSVADH